MSTAEQFQTSAVSLCEYTFNLSENSVSALPPYDTSKNLLHVYVCILPCKKTSCLTFSQVDFYSNKRPPYNEIHLCII